MYIVPVIKTAEKVPLLTVAQTMARLSGHTEAKYEGSFACRGASESTYFPVVSVVISDKDTPSTGIYLAHLKSEIGSPKNITPEEALSHLTDDVQIIFSHPKVTPELIEKVQAELGIVNTK